MTLFISTMCDNLELNPPFASKSCARCCFTFGGFFLAVLAVGLACSIGGLRCHLYNHKHTTSKLNIFIHALLHTRLNCVQPHMCAHNTLCAGKERGGSEVNGFPT